MQRNVGSIQTILLMHWQSSGIPAVEITILRWLTCSEHILRLNFTTKHKIAVKACRLLWMLLESKTRLKSYDRPMR